MPLVIVDVVVRSAIAITFPPVAESAMNTLWRVPQLAVGVGKTIAVAFDFVPPDAVGKFVRLFGTATLA